MEGVPTNLHLAPGLAYAVAIVWAVVAGHLLIGRLIDRVWRLLPSKAGEQPVPDRPGRFTVRLVGAVEAVVYVAAVGMAMPLLVSAWLVMKGLVLVWPTKSEIGVSGDARDEFNVFLAGNGISLAFGLGAGAAAVEMAGTGDLSVIALGLLGPLALVGAGALYVRRVEQNRKSAPPEAPVAGPVET